MGLPLVLGTLSGHRPLGYALALGGLAVPRPGPGVRGRGRLGGYLRFLPAAALAAALVVAVPGPGPGRDLTLAAAAGLAAVLGGINRPLAAGAAQTVVLLMLLKALPGLGGQRAAGFQAVFLAGAVWASAVDWACHRLADRGGVGGAGPTGQPALTFRQAFRRWRTRLGEGTALNYPIRLLAGLLAAAALEQLRPGHHASWISLTVVLVTPRAAEPFPVKATQRAAGTLAGVGLAWLVVGASPPWWLPAGAAALLAGARAFLKGRNYLAYTAVLTPLVMVLLDGVSPPGPRVLVDRLAATLVAAALVMAVGLVGGRLPGDRGRPSGARWRAAAE
jgi:hypothetical protein